MSFDDADIEQVHEIVHSNCCLTVREIAEQCNILIGSFHDIPMTKLEMRWVVSKFVPRLLTEDQRDSRFAIVRNFWIMLVGMKTF
jgi:hypothetical protein